MDGIQDLAGALSGVGLAAWLFAVVWHGNTKQLGHMLIQEEGYVEFVAALVLLGIVNKYGPDHQVLTAITSMAIIAVMIRIGAKADLSPLHDFFTGKANALTTLERLMPNKA